MKHFTLAAFSAEQRMAAVAIFRNSQLEDLQLRHIVPDISKASGSVRQLVTRVIEQYTPEFIAISCPSAKAAGRTRALCDVVKQIASDFGIPATEVNDCTLQACLWTPTTDPQRTCASGRSTDLAKFVRREVQTCRRRCGDDRALCANRTAF